MPVFTPNAPVIYTLDILSNILQHLSWQSLLLWQGMPGAGPYARFVEIRRRVFLALSPFIPRRQVPTFLDALQGSEGLIVGSVARQVQLWGSDHEGNQPIDLNVIIGRSAQDLIHQVLLDCGYQSENDLPRPLYSRLVAKLEVYTQTQANGLVRRILNFDSIQS
jgi:hypothetical protein